MKKAETRPCIHTNGALKSRNCFYFIPQFLLIDTFSQFQKYPCDECGFVAVGEENLTKHKSLNHTEKTSSKNFSVPPVAYFAKKLRIHYHPD